jgi:hypothetical protein
MPEFDRVGKLHVVPIEKPTIAVAVPAGTNVEKVLQSEALVNAVRGIGPRGCETCISGREFLVNIYEEVTLVEFAE